jgi:excisionase family DNA binding protein
MDENVLSTLEASRILDCAPDTVRRLVREGVLTAAVSTCAGRLVRRADVEALAAKRRQLREARTQEHQQAAAV